MQFIKKILRQRKIKKYSTILNHEIAKKNKFEYLIALPDKLKSKIKQLQNDDNYLVINDLYNEYQEIYQKQNKKLDEIKKAAKDFPLNDIVNNPKAINHTDLVKKYGQLLNELKAYQISNNKIRQFKNLLDNLLNNYNDLCSQYDEYVSMKNFNATIPDIYIDIDLKNELITKIDQYVKTYKARSYNFYPIVGIDIYLIIDKHNKDFINNHIKDEIFDNINSKCLDLEQRRAILTDDKSNLVVAGAGSGKTLTICGKVKYLIERLNVPAEKILLLSYSKKSATDLENKVHLIDNNLKVNTFHALGLEILNQASGKKQTVDDNFKAVLERYFSKYLFTNMKDLQLVLMYYALYLNSDNHKSYSNVGEIYEDLKRENYLTLKNQVELNNSKRETLQKELVKSKEELSIANFLYINGINYEYESTYKEENTATSQKRQYTPDFYLPDYKIYYEHYGVNEKGEAVQYKAEEAIEYVKSMEWKRALHIKNHTTCIETYSYEYHNGTLFTNLEKRLKEHGVIFKPLTGEDILNTMESIYNGQSFKSLINLITTFISLYKAKYDNAKYFDILQKNKELSGFEKTRAKYFIDICRSVYNYYIEHLSNEGKIDFDDMILKSTELLDKVSDFKYQYIIVDEFQDISMSRMKFLRKLVSKNNSKIFAVGDDWQAIYRFTGCDVSLFTNFDKNFAGTSKSFLTSTHRNSQELQDIAGPFIMANPEQYKKQIKSEKHLVRPVKIAYFENNQKSSVFIKILEVIYNLDNHAKILLLGRNNNDINSLFSLEFNREKNKLIARNYPTLNITFSTVHSAKGLEEDYAIIINGDGDKYGFPNKMEDDPLLNLVLGTKSSYEFAEERRLFYVALTRTKYYTYILVNSSNPSIFVEEIKDKCEVINQVLNNNVCENLFCPKCKSGHLIKRNHEGRAFLGCSNFPYCDYTNNEVNQVVKYHKICPICGNYMVIRRGKYGYFWGCSSYPKCNHTEPYSPNN